MAARYTGNLRGPAEARAMNSSEHYRQASLPRWCIATAIVLAACGLSAASAGTTAGRLAARPATTSFQALTCDSKPVRNLTGGVDGAHPLAFDGLGRLYVANFQNDTLAIYDPGSDTPRETIHAGLSAPDALAVDGAGEVYVANFGSDSVGVYASGKL